MITEEAVTGELEGEPGAQAAPVPAASAWRSCGSCCPSRHSWARRKGWAAVRSPLPAFPDAAVCGEPGRRHARHDQRPAPLVRTGRYCAGEHEPGPRVPHQRSIHRQSGCCQRLANGSCVGWRCVSAFAGNRGRRRHAGGSAPSLSPLPWSRAPDGMRASEATAWLEPSSTSRSRPVLILPSRRVPKTRILSSR